MEKLETLRSEIDQADAEILGALARRMGLIEQVFHEKERRGLVIFSAERERLVIVRLVEKAEELRLDIKFVERLLREIISHSRRVQADRRMECRDPDAARVKAVSYQGSPGAYSWMAGDGTKSSLHTDTEGPRDLPPRRWRMACGKASILF